MKARAKLSLSLRAIALVAILNAGFFLVLGFSAVLPTEAFKTRVRNAFATGQLNREVDYAGYNRDIGLHQYDDCTILQMLINPGENWLHRALGPIIYFQQHYLHACDTLYRLVHDPHAAEGVASFPYTRYWHGDYPLAALWLSQFGLKTVRLIFKASIYLALLWLPFAAGFRDRVIFALALSIAVTGLFFWGLQYYGQSLCHGPGDAVVIVGIGLFLALRNRTANLKWMILFSAGFGAIVTFMEFLTGLLPTGASLLFITAFMIRQRSSEVGPERNSLAFAWLALISFTAGSVLTVVFKQALAAIFIGPQAITAFSSSLAKYSASAEPPTARLWLIIAALKQLLAGSNTLTGGNFKSALVLLALSAIAWSVAFLIVVFNRHSRFAVAQFKAFLMSVSIIIVWVALLSSHTIQHSFFMSRMLLIPISLGWAFLSSTLLTLKTKTRTG